MPSFTHLWENNAVATFVIVIVGELKIHGQPRQTVKSAWLITVCVMVLTQLYVLCYILTYSIYNQLLLGSTATKLKWVQPIWFE